MALFRCLLHRVRVSVCPLPQTHTSISSMSLTLPLDIDLHASVALPQHTHHTHQQLSNHGPFQHLRRPHSPGPQHPAHRGARRDAHAHASQRHRLHDPRHGLGQWHDEDRKDGAPLRSGRPLSLLSAPPLPRAPCSFTSRTPFHYMYPLLFDGGRARAHLLCYPFDPIVRASFTAPLTHCSPCSRSPCSLPLLTAPLARSAPT